MAEAFPDAVRFLLGLESSDAGVGDGDDGTAKSKRRPHSLVDVTATGSVRFPASVQITSGQFKPLDLAYQVSGDCVNKRGGKSKDSKEVVRLLTQAKGCKPLPLARPLVRSPTTPWVQSCVIPWCCNGVALYRGDALLAYCNVTVRISTCVRVCSVPMSVPGCRRCRQSSSLSPVLLHTEAN